MKLAIWALATALLIPSIASADRADKAARRAQILQQFDADRDGRLDKHERKQAKRARKQQKRMRKLARFIERYDANGDGVVGPGEAPPKALRKLHKLDHDGDGWVTPDEQFAGKQKKKHKRQLAPLPHPPYAGEVPYGGDAPGEQ